MAFVPTPEQGQAIDKKGSIIVSAAAGSGKTAVLVERVAKLLSDKSDPIPADKLLIVTYTTAAAAELRYRIDKRLSAEFDKNPNDGYLQRQKILLSSAKICTIDSFCIDFIRENFELTGLDPSFKIADKATLNSVYNFALSTVFNEHFEQKDKEFLDLLAAFGEKRDDAELRDCVYKIYEYSQHIPFPDNWLDGIVKSYEDHAKGLRTDWCSQALNVAETYAVDAQLEFKEALSLLETSPLAYEKYAANYEYFLSFSEDILEICRSGDWDTLFTRIGKIDPPKCKNLTKDEKTELVADSVKLRDSGKKKLAAISSLVYCPKSGTVDEFAAEMPFVKKIISLVKEYGEKVSQILHERGLITFLLAEQTALSLLAEVREGEIVRSSLADSFSEQFDAVLVDEYQDTNTLQDTLFHFLSDNGKKLFCVGDMKQCIYKFRGANPTNFLRKKEAAFFDQDRISEDHALRIDLGCNFRSRKEVCEYINSIFKKILYSENSGFEYDSREELVSKAEYPENSENKIESHFLDFSSIAAEGAYENKRQAEAQAVAETIIDIINRPPFLKGENGLRQAEYKDVTILLRSLREKGATYAKALKDNGIPVSLAASDGLESDEVNTLISMLKVINNPSDNIALLTVLTSPMFGISMEELALVRAEHKRGSYYSAVLAAYKNGNESVKNFVEILTRLRRKVALSSVASLISDIFEETGMLSMVSIAEEGEIRRQNLLYVQSLSASFEKESRKDLRSFLKYFETLTDKDFSVESSAGNAVTIMSIHGSKGLQFPICILANCSNQFNKKDTYGKVILNEPHGLSFKMFGSDGKAIDNNILRSIMAHEETKELYAEELRVFYVALTRAEEKLITFSSYNDLTDEIEKKSALLERAEAKYKLPYSVFRRSKCYADWITESYIIDGYADVLLSETGNDRIKIHNQVSLPSAKAIETAKPEADISTVEALKEGYRFEYPFKDIIGLQSKSSVTDIVHKADREEYLFSSRPAFLQEKGLSSAERGTAVHKVLQHFDLSAADNIEAELERLYEYMYISEGEYDSIDKAILVEFFKSELFSRIRNADTVKREFRFLAEFPATELDPKLGPEFSGEAVVVQGSVDLLFVERGEIVILDFKTDRNKNEEELISAYKQQLEIYSKACSKLLKLPVKELLIYSFSLGKTIKL